MNRIFVVVSLLWCVNYSAGILLSGILSAARRHIGGMIFISQPSMRAFPPGFGWQKGLDTLLRSGKDHWSPTLEVPVPILKIGCRRHWRRKGYMPGVDFLNRNPVHCPIVICGLPTERMASCGVWRLVFHSCSDLTCSRRCPCSWWRDWRKQ